MTDRSELRSEFSLDIDRIRENARTECEKGVVTEDFPASRASILRLLDNALATEWICVLRYTQHAHVARGINAGPVVEHFTEHAREELEHAEALARRIRQLGGTPRLDPARLSSCAHTEYRECPSLAEMIRENLFAERVAIEVYREIVKYIDKGDPTTRRLLEKILAKEEEHADELADLLSDNATKTALN